MGRDPVTLLAVERQHAGHLPKGAHAPVRTAIISTYPPRACGIGTFALDVRTRAAGTSR